MKNKKTEYELVRELLQREGFTEITEKEKKSPEFRESISRTRKLKESIKPVSRRCNTR